MRCVRALRVGEKETERQRQRGETHTQRERDRDFLRGKVGKRRRPEYLLN